MNKLTNERTIID